MDKEELYEKIKEQKKGLKRTNSEITADYFAGKEVEYLPYALNGPEFAIANYLGYNTTDLFSNPDCQKEVAEEKREFEAEGNCVFLEGKMIASLVGSGLAIPINDIPRNSSQVLKDYKDFPPIRDYDFLSSDLYKENIEMGKFLVKTQPDIPMSIAINGPITFAATIRPVELILRDMRKDKEKLHQLMDWATNTLIDWIRLYYKEIGQGGLEFMEPVATTDLVSPDQFREFIFPYLKRMIDETNKLTDEGVNCHICGRTRGIWKDLGKLDLRSFSVDNVEDIGELKEVLGDKMIIRGNIPPVDVLRYGTIDDVIESVRVAISKAADSPKGFILEAGCMITPGTPRENLWALIYATRKYGAGARIGRMPEGIKDL